MRKKFGPAFAGLLAGLRHKAVLTQFVLGFCAVAVGLILHLSSMEWIAVILCIGLVITAEYLNTAIEFLCNYLTGYQDERIRVIKDLSAGAVLAASMAALAVAIILVFRHF